MRCSRQSVAQGGFTLTELMVTVAITGILSATAVVSVKQQKDPGDEALRLSALARQCSSLAVTHGPLRSDVLANLGSRARARLVLGAADANGNQEVSVEVLEEEDLPSNGAVWRLTSRFFLSGGLRVVGTAASSNLASGLGPGADPADGAELLCYPNGSTDSLTYYLDWGGSASERSRVVVMSMTGEPIVLAGW